MVGNGSQFIVHDGGTSALGVGFREADLRPWKTMPGKRLRVRRRRWTGSSAAYEVVDEADALRWTSAPMEKGRSMKVAVPWRSLFCGGDRKWGVFRCTTWVPGWGWLGRVNLKLRKQPPTNRHP